MTSLDIEGLNWEKGSGLLPVIIQHADQGTVLMTGFVNQEALALMLEQGEVALYSRTRRRLWVKGETSGQRIAVQEIVPDCDRDALLVLGLPIGAVCHTGARTCFADVEPRAASLSFLVDLERIVAERVGEPREGSYTASLVAQGPRRIAQKVGEEALEVVLAATGTQEEILGEAADLLFHLIVLLETRRVGLADVVRVLQTRHINLSHGAVAGLTIR